MIELKRLKYIINDININEYIKYREIAKKNMEYPEWLGDLSKKDLEFMLNNNAKIWMFYNGDEFVCSMMIIPSTDEALSKFKINKLKEETIDYGPMFVNKKYIGNGLQYQMLCELDKYCLLNGYKYAIATIHPDNTYSINNILKDNFEYKNTLNLTRGKRNIYIKKLN